MVRTSAKAFIITWMFVGLLTGSRLEAAGIVFRYLPGTPSLSTRIESMNVEDGPFLDPVERVARGPGGWGYDAPWAGEFEAPESVLWSAATEDMNQPLGPALTAEVWMRLLEVDESHTLITNRIGTSDGFTLGLEEGVAYFEIVVGGTSYRASGTVPVSENKDVWLTATADYAGASVIEIHLYENGKPVGTTSISASISTPYAIRHPFYIGTTAEGSDEAPILTGTITGLVYAAVVRDYVANSDYLNSPPPFDGSTYFGLPDFHDYEPGSFRLPMDQRIDSYSGPLKQKMYLPHVNDEFIPQGTAVVSHDDSKEADLIYISYYHRTRDNRLRVQRSIIAEIEAATGTVRRTFRLTGRLDDSHAGGIALAGEALYVSSEGYLERYPLPPYDPEAPRYLDLTSDDSGSRHVQSKSSFVSVFADTMWVGDYRTANEQAPYLYGYPLDGEGILISGADPVIYPIPRRIQGVDFFTHDGTTYVFMSRNRNANEGEVLRFRRSDLDVHSVPTSSVSITLPHGIEDLSFAEDGTLWTNSESGTDFYQRNVEWSSFFPFVYGVERHAVVPTTVERDAPPAEILRVDVYPNPATRLVTIRFRVVAPTHAKVRVTDSLGREVVVLLDRAVRQGSHAVHWDADRLAQGLYFVSVDAGKRRQVHSITLVR